MITEIREKLRESHSLWMKGHRFAPPLACSGKSKLFQNYAALCQTLTYKFAKANLGRRLSLSAQTRKKPSRKDGFFLGRQKVTAIEPDILDKLYLVLTGYDTLKYKVDRTKLILKNLVKPDSLAMLHILR